MGIGSAGVDEPFKACVVGRIGSLTPWQADGAGKWAGQRQWGCGSYQRTCCGEEG
jgi:hypothetical protein